MLPALTIEDIAINSAANILQFRDVNLARAEEETCREVVRRIPISDQLITDIAAHAREHEIAVEARRRKLQSNSYRPPSQKAESYAVTLGLDKRF